MKSKIVDIDVDLVFQIKHEDGSKANDDELALIESVMGGLIQQLVAMSEEE